MSENAGALAVARQFVDLLNRGDSNAAEQLLTDDVVVVDDVAPFRWKGSVAAKTWLRLIDGTRKRLHASLELVELDRVSGSGSQAYLVVPGTLNMTSAGGDFSTSGLLTLTFQRVENEWLVSTVVWSARE